MSLKILIVQEVEENYPDTFTSYKAIFDFLGYENTLCHEVDKLPEMIKTFDPNLVFWIYPSSKAISDLLIQYRQENKKLKVIWAFNFYGRMVGAPWDYYDYAFVPVVFGIGKLKRVIIELFGESYVTDKLSEYELEEE